MSIEDYNKNVNLAMWEYRMLKEQSRRYSKIHRVLLEFMGYEDEFLVTKKGLSRLIKDDLVVMVLEQRAMIRKLIDDLEPSKQDEHIQALDDLYLNKNKIY